ENGANSRVNINPLDDTHVHYALTQQKTIFFPEENESLYFEGGLAPDQPKHQTSELPCVIDSTLSNMSRRTSGSLSSYSDILPAVKAKPKTSQFIIFPRSDKEEIERTQEMIHPSSSLWFYTDERAAV